MMKHHQSFIKNALQKRIGMIAAIATVFLIAAVGSASADHACVADDGSGDAYFCNDTILKSCTLNGSMTCADTGKAGLKVGADDITINGAGYILDGVNPICAWNSVSSGILNEDYDNVTIKNLEVKKFCFGIGLRGTLSNRIENNKIENCNVHHNGNATSEVPTHGIKMEYVFNSTIGNNSIHDTIAHVKPNPGCEDGGNGMFLYRGDYNLITQNKFYNNTKGGLFMKMMPMYNILSYNELWGNGQGGIIFRCCMCNFNLVEKNNASDNFGSGIFIGGNNNTIRYNVVRNNKDGGPYYGDISVGGKGYGINIGRSDGSCYNELYENTVCGNDYKDIYVVHGVIGNHGVNNTCDTTSYYNDEGATGCTYPCSAGVIADFSAEPTKGTSPLKVAFTDRSKPEGDITGWLWDFGDGNTSNEQNPVHTYYTTKPYSYYNVSLTVSGSGGASGTVTRTDYIKVWREDAAPNADFLCSKGVGVPSVPVQFTDKSLGEVTSWLWDFGDGETNSTQNPEHYYSAEGIYNVSLTVTGGGGSSKETKFLCVRVGSGSGEKWPLIDAHFFASARTGNAPFTVTFTDMSRSKAEIDLWKWNFGDGNISSEKNPTHRYNNAGTYNVSLEVTNTEDAKAKEIKIGYIEVKEEAIFDTGAPENPYPSIFGTHKGKIIPDRDITVNRMYTYPCKGTGGHAEYVRIWNESEGMEGIGNWSGYQGDYHNITISPAITLLKNHEYNYTIITGSYPQIIHAREYKAEEGGNITCEEFIDANGRKYDDWIPAIRLYL